MAEKIKKNSKKGRNSNKWCSCGYKKHGQNHEQGAHHKKGKR